MILAISASAFEDDRDLILEAGCDDFLHKPFNHADLFAMLEKHLELKFVYEGVA